MAYKITGARTGRTHVGKFGKWIFPAIRQMTLRSAPVRARTRKLRALWTVENYQDLHAFYSIYAEDFVQVQPMAEYQTSMRQIKVNKAKLLEILKKNRQEHRGLFLEAQKKFREVAIKALDATLKAARDGKEFVLADLATYRAPQDHTRDYDRSIKMLEMSVDEDIVINDQEFQNYVQDTWGWSRDWAVSNAGYVTKSSRYYGKLSAMAGDDEN